MPCLFRLLERFSTRARRFNANGYGIASKAKEKKAEESERVSSLTKEFVVNGGCQPVVGMDFIGGRQ